MRGVISRLGFLAGLIVVVCWPSSGETKMSCSEDVMCISTKRQGKGVWFSAINKMPHAPLTMAIRLKLDNLELSKGTNEISILRPGQTRRLFYLEPKDSGRWKYSYTFHWAYGELDASHNENLLYALPYEVGQKFRVSQGCNGEFSHTDGEEFAIDFKLPLNTPVHAARGGRVVVVKQDSNRGGPNRRYKDDANVVVIQHDDGTLGYYFHLAPDSSLVQPGNMVETGQMIARSGNTGFSTGPHLHFEVSKPVRQLEDDGGIKTLSLPIRFKTSDGPVICPAKGSRLRAVR